jgi:hypothetical protein
VRTQPERAGFPMAFSPVTRRLQWLDLSAWLIFELCDGRSGAELERAYLDAVGDAHDGEARRQLRTGLDALVAGGLITRDTPTATEVHGDPTDDRAGREATSAPSVTSGSSAERRWNPYYVVDRTLKAG